MGNSWHRNEGAWQGRGDIFCYRMIQGSVEKMDHGQMSLFCEDLYNRGYEAGKQEILTLSDEEITQTIFLVKGIGEKKANDVLQALSLAKERKALTNG